MKKQFFINANIIDPHNSLNENGGLIIGEDGKIEAIGKKVNTNNLPTREKAIDLKGSPLAGMKAPPPPPPKQEDPDVSVEGLAEAASAPAGLPSGIDMS